MRTTLLLFTAFYCLYFSLPTTSDTLELSSSGSGSSSLHALLPRQSEVQCNYTTKCPEGCHFHGNCVKAECVCYPGWSGESCQIYNCSSACGPHSRCLSNGTCLCDPGFGGDNCTDLICMPHAKGSCCDPRGNCVCNGTKCPDDVGIDLVVVAAYINPVIKVKNFSECHCAVNETCTVPGVRRLLNFGTYLRNIGPVDLFFGRPGAYVDGGFHYHDCHDHAHFHDTASFELRHNTTDEILVGKKHGFCLVDSFASAGAPHKTRVYDCTNQGLQTQWNDAYGPELDCQWLDITDVEPGTYQLVMEVNPLRKIVETNYDNNNVTITVEIPPSDTKPNPTTHDIATKDTPTNGSYVEGPTTTLALMTTSILLLCSFWLIQ